ncbi:sugar (and other) transporter family protein [Paraburkholderia xenovorans LB400]|uniref:Major facilitator superfamily (MFS) aromatic acid/H+ symporter n=1 Tax=Paraburkholderia xenovorans (strain LB400) TaxID=266265 RepID=Q13I23_PARXL|nr:aromatic acid/H+ symport family MFS transporter [Paraburkholderia xenovorans]ABE36266.1 major facilitator superfamily (MFS) aromatic acid/H+ symporter [Paraburkholderia xenovorans LB400]AIP35105.1 sugar (and other) transporter family protein [Paraburkholderia xenovorans LB400]
MTSLRRLSVRDLIDGRPFGRFQTLLVFLGFMTIVLDGFDAVVMGYIAPQLKLDWGLSHESLGAVLSAGLIGQAIGAMAGGPLADRYGRKPVVVSNVLFFGIWTLATAMSSDVRGMVIFRFLTGLGLGAAIPNTSTLISEYAPQRMRSFLITVTLCGYTAGGAGGGFISAWMIPAFGWRSVVLAAGVLPVILGVILMALMPESLGFLVARKKGAAAVKAIVARIAPEIARTPYELVQDAQSPHRSSSIRIVLAPQYRMGTAMLWCGYFCVLFLIYLLSSWLPTLVKEGGGYSVSESAIAMAMFQVGGPIGSLAIGWAMDRWSKHWILAGVFLIGAASVAAIGETSQYYLALCGLALVVGFCMSGGSVGMTALATGYYPTEARATGSSWMLGIGRIGAILSAMLGAEMLSLGWSMSDIFTALVIPALIAAVAVLAHKRWDTPRAAGVIQHGAIPHDKDASKPVSTNP